MSLIDGVIEELGAVVADGGDVSHPLAVRTLEALCGQRARIQEMMGEVINALAQ